jgi:hypothetical protein
MVGGRVRSVGEIVNGVDVTTGGDVAVTSEMSASVGFLVGKAVGFATAIGLFVGVRVGSSGDELEVDGVVFCGGFWGLSLLFPLGEFFLCRHEIPSQS